MREDCDIVLVGEMRDLETVAIAIETAETGHLVLATMHSPNVALALERPELVVDAVVVPRRRLGRIGCGR